MNNIFRKSLCKFPSFPWKSCSVATRRITPITAVTSRVNSNLNQAFIPIQETKIDAAGIIKYWKKRDYSPNLNRCGNGMVYQYLNDAQKKAEISSLINGMKTLNTNGQWWTKENRLSMVSLYSVQSGSDPEEENYAADASDDAQNGSDESGNDDLGRRGNDDRHGKRIREAADEDIGPSSKVQRTDVAGPSNREVIRLTLPDRSTSDTPYDPRIHGPRRVNVLIPVDPDATESDSDCETEEQRQAARADLRRQEEARQQRERERQEAAELAYTSSTESGDSGDDDSSAGSYRSVLDVPEFSD